MKNTILSQKEAQLLEALITNHGLVVTTGQILERLKKDKSRQEGYNLMTKLAKAGWLVRIRQGVYYIANLESRGTVGLSVITIAQLIQEDSYISFEAALQYHGMFDQHLRAVYSITLKKTKNITIQNTDFHFIRTNRKMYYGFEKDWVEGRPIKVATAEKAILDILNFRRTDYMADIVLEKLRVYRDVFDWKRLFGFAENQNLAVKRTLGFLLDKLFIDNEDLYNQVKKANGYNYLSLSREKQNFNAKWRLYHSEHFQ